MYYLCVIQNHENDEKEGIHTQMSQADQTRELHPHIRGSSASRGVRSTDETASGKERAGL